MKLCSWLGEELLLMGAELSATSLGSDCRLKAAAKPDLSLLAAECAAVLDSGMTFNLILFHNRLKT